MKSEGNILDLLAAESIKAELKTKRALIIQPGAIGDCILTLPLAAFLKENLKLGGVDILGHTEYIGIFPGRTCINSISSIDSIDLHRLFVDSNEFVLADRDPLIKTFSGYSWLISFLGEPESNFEKNLLFTTNCSHNSEVITLSLQPSSKLSEHITVSFLQQFINQSGVPLKITYFSNQDRLIKATKTDIIKGKELLWEFGLEPQKKLVVIQPGSGAINKCWHEENYISIVNELRLQNIQVVFLLGPAELERFSTLTIKNLTNATKCLVDLSLTDVLNILTCTDAFVGNDSGITHLAAAMGIKTLVVFGPTNPVVYKPNGPNVTTFSGEENFSKEPSIELQKRLMKILLAEIIKTNQ